MRVPLGQYSLGIVSELLLVNSPVLPISRDAVDILGEALIRYGGDGLHTHVVQGLQEHDGFALGRYLVAVKVTAN